MALLQSSLLRYLLKKLKLPKLQTNSYHLVVIMVLSLFSSCS
ncbi:hypothetical protein MTR67_024744 [Solanum verrucosum]|uniref:Uncharacterized protein n=1 Tax=Solanum verrucosum TaxID=315347 RepID=A0AAF0TT87_SOLVR|nr:hypothetical protein MTR67_024744 [Solanum verrucosum]